MSQLSDSVFIKYRGIDQGAMEKSVAKLLWTGGWDSTFRLLQLLLIEKREVQPYYIRFPGQETAGSEAPPRRSTGKEIETMDRIRQRLYKEYPYTKGLLLPTIYVDTRDIKTDKKIEKSYKAIKYEKYIGHQYVAIACFAEQNEIQQLELSVEMEGHSHEVLEPHVHGSSITGVYELNNEVSNEDVYNLYKNFSFPLLKYTKKEMAAVSQREGWMPFMKMTWFCHRPYFGKYPCGACNPCVSTYKSATEWRLPLFSRLFGRTFKKIYHSKIPVKLRGG